MTAQDTFEALKYRIEVDDTGARYYYNAAGEFHRIDGPAVEYPDGTKYWYIDGKLHRTDGPAIEYVDGGKAWSIDGHKYSEEEFNALVKK